MHPILNQNTFFVKEHTGVFKASNNYDIYNPQTQELALTCREENLGIFTRLLRFTDYKRMTPFRIEVRSADGEKVLTVRRGVSFFLSKVEVLDHDDEVVGKLKQKFFSIGGKFNVVDTADNYLFSLKGKWTSWDFKFVKDNLEFAHINKKWAGMGKELFTSADNYMLTMTDQVPENNNIRLLILGAVMCIDMVLKE
ncbi:phospholipid scramblase-related protein [Pontibacter anaerobius]|uniref:Phospholipid scramblase-related protein n=1 Tax=Pontibacter anaerobius TaxID=2993940 RepID=A0ABT3RJ49_9BACT|nr:phospholipid scramblase-related protein [Pontibacter anaerobius]MCX2741399.1 phospholipid scramblase-related protein [Pontibacter anaerobius]